MRYAYCPYPGLLLDFSAGHIVRIDGRTKARRSRPPRHIRRVYSDNAKSPGTLWFGNNHGASIVKVEPLD